MPSDEVLEAFLKLTREDPLVQELAFVQDMIKAQQQMLELLRLREARVWERIETELARSAGSAARETPGVSTEQRT